MQAKGQRIPFGKEYVFSCPGMFPPAQMQVVKGSQTFWKQKVQKFCDTESCPLSRYLPSSALGKSSYTGHTWIFIPQCCIWSGSYQVTIYKIASKESFSRHCRPQIVYWQTSWFPERFRTELFAFFLCVLLALWCLLVSITLLTFPYCRPNGKLSNIQCYLLMGKSFLTRAGWLWIWCYSNWTLSCGLDDEGKYFIAKMQYISYLKNCKPALT